MTFLGNATKGVEIQNLDSKFENLAATMRAMGEANRWDEVSLDEIDKALTEILLKAEKDLLPQPRTNRTNNLSP